MSSCAQAHLCQVHHPVSFGIDFAVPYCVSSHRATKAELNRRRGKRMEQENTLKYSRNGIAIPQGNINAMDLVAIRKDMLRFAELQLRDTDAAEDVVQDAIEAALRNSSGFSGRAALKTWVFGILKNKIVDHLRQKHRTSSFSSLIQDDDEWDQKLEQLFNERGFWNPQMQPAKWPDPEESLANHQFWRVFDACLDHLPENIARVFMMREFLGFDPNEICEQLAITTSNCHVILHRARVRLRGCLESGWVTQGAM